MIGAPGFWRRKLTIDGWLRRACKATNKSYGFRIETRWPSRLRILAQRSAVMRFPYLESGGAGVTMPIVILPESAAHRSGIPPIRRDGQAGRNFDRCYE